MFTSILFLLLIRGTVNSTTPPNCEGHSEGESWVSQPCEFCSCKSGNKICSSPDCHVPCDDPVPGDGACCPTCPGDTQQTSYRPWQCLVCPPGSPGPRGMPGQQGVPGRDGRDGRDQPSGCPGSNTPTEEPPITDGEDQTGVTYVHWGKDSCPSHSLLVYQGVVGGKQYTQKGSGTNYLCLHSSPTYLRPRAGRRSFAAYIYGTEMESGGYAEGFPDLHLESEVACSVCLARSKRNVLMIPGVHSCPVGQGWTEEYHGYLMANHHGYYATEFICVDHEAEGIPNTGHDNDPALLYIAEGVCSGHGGGLPCPPYVDGHELTCVVCSL